MSIQNICLFFSLCLSLLIGSESLAQHSYPSYIENQPIELSKGLTLRYKVSHVDLKSRDVKQLLRNDSRALSAFKTGQTLEVLSTVVGAAGGGMVGWTIGTYLAGPKRNRFGQPTENIQMNWTVFGIGAGLVAASTVLSIFGRKSKVDAINTYNEKFPSPSASRNAPQIMLAEEGIGIAVRL